MCDVAFIGPTIKAVGYIYEHNAANARADAQQKANDQRQANADAAYLANLNDIDKDKSKVEAEEQRATMELEREARRKNAEALNAGFGNPNAIFRRIGGETQLALAGIQTDAANEIITLTQQQDAAYAELQQDYLALPLVERPSLFGTGLKIAGAAAEGYSNRSRGSGRTVGSEGGRGS